MKCYDCEYNMKVVMSVMRSNANEAEASRKDVYTRICLAKDNIFELLEKKIPTNHKPMRVVGTDDLLIKHCTKHVQRSIKEDSPSVSSAQLAHEVGSTHVDPNSRPDIQWERILNLLNTNGLTIIRREIDD